MESGYTMERIKSDKGKNFPEMHTLIMNLKSWLRGYIISVMKSIYRLTRMNFSTVLIEEHLAKADFII